MIPQPNGRIKSLTLIRLSEPGVPRIREPSPADYFNVYLEDPSAPADKWRADALTNQTFDRASLITSNPIVTGVNVTDHIVLGPRRFSGTVWLTDHPILPLQSRFAGESRSQQLLTQLEALQVDRAIVMLATSLGVIPIAAISNISSTRDPETGMAETATITVQELRLASVSFVDSIDDLQSQLGRGLRGSTITTVVGG